MDSETADVPACGFGFGDGSFCREPADGDRCPRHGEVQYRICQGCSNAASRFCGPNCATVLCGECTHYRDGGHGPAADEPPFTQQQAVDPASAIRRQMIDVVTEALQGTAVRGLCSFPSEEHIARVAGVVVDHQSAKALATLYEGLAVQQAAGGRHP